MTPQTDVDELHADLYDAFTRAHDRFAAIGRALVALAGDLRGRCVVDLACGTGVVTRELLRVGAGQVVGVDISPRMLAHARRDLADAPVRLVCAAAEQLDGAVATAPAIDAVVCNAAIWYMDPAAVARAVDRVLRPGGVFAFNFAQAERPSTDLHGAMRAIAEREGLTLASARAVAPRHALLAAVTQVGLTLERAVETTVHESVASQRDFLRLPGSTFRTLPGVPYGDRMRILEQAWGDVGERAPQAVRWIHVLTRKPDRP